MEGDEILLSTFIRTNDAKVNKESTGWTLVVHIGPLQLLARRQTYWHWRRHISYSFIQTDIIFWICRFSRLLRTWLCFNFEFVQIKQVTVLLKEFPGRNLGSHVAKFQIAGSRDSFANQRVGKLRATFYRKLQCVRARSGMRAKRISGSKMRSCKVCLTGKIDLIDLLEQEVLINDLGSKVTVRELDWLHDQPGERFDFHADVVIAADVVYDAAFTNRFWTYWPRFEALQGVGACLQRAVADR